MREKNPIFLFLNGKHYTHNGISGKLYRTEAMSGHAERITHEPDVIGKRTDKYKETKKQLGDDWDCDLTQDPESYCEIADALGYRPMMTVSEIASQIPIGTTVEGAYDVGASIHPVADGTNARTLVENYIGLPEVQIYQDAIGCTREETPAESQVIALVALWQMRRAVQVYINN